METWGSRASVSFVTAPITVWKGLQKPVFVIGLFVQALSSMRLLKHNCIVAGPLQVSHKLLEVSHCWNCGTAHVAWKLLHRESNIWSITRDVQACAHSHSEKRNIASNQKWRVVFHLYWRVSWSCGRCQLSKLFFLNLDQLPNAAAWE